MSEPTLVSAYAIRTRPPAWPIFRRRHHYHAKASYSQCSQSPHRYACGEEDSTDMTKGRGHLTSTRSPAPSSAFGGSISPPHGISGGAGAWLPKMLRSSSALPRLSGVERRSNFAVLTGSLSTSSRLTKIRQAVMPQASAPCVPHACNGDSFGEQLVRTNPVVVVVDEGERHELGRAGAGE